VDLLLVLLWDERAVFLVLDPLCLFLKVDIYKYINIKYKTILYRMSGTILSTNVSFSDIVAKYNNINDPNLSTGKINLSQFRGKEFSTGAAVPTGSNPISIGTDFKSRTWKAPGPSGWVAVSNSTSQNGNNTQGIINLWYKRSVIKFTYSQSLLSSKGIISGSIIKNLKFNVTGAISSSSSYQPFPSYTIAMKNSSSAASVNPGTSGWSVVKAAHSFYATSTGEHTFDITDFTYTGGTLCFSFSWGATPHYIQAGQSYVFSDSGDAYMFYSKTDSGGTYSYSSAATNSDNANVPRVDMYF
jgi:hypothetical protein